MSERIERWIQVLARLTALAGGLVLTALIIITVISVTGRALVFAGLGPIPGDFELVEAGTAFAVFAFLPWCHLRRGHAVVEVLTMHFSDNANRLIEIVSNFLMLVFALLICWRHWLGTIDKYNYTETTFILQFPIWWAYAAGLFGAVVFVIVTLWCFWRSVIEYRTGSDIAISGELS
ncbi:TRAP transporter small permease [Hoeflea sp. TYP-13]|uniref:TRAP transporter small permease n=1 Tax=Hoeflea sp. TYP-13 TaxID=3230023 RepID=UPI0034C5EECD